MADPMILILAGGEGRRIGGRKPLRRLAGRSLIDRVIDYARDHTDLVALSVVRGGQARDLPQITDDPEIDGPLGGLASGLRFAREQEREFLLTLPCDMPFLPGDLLPLLKRAIDRSTVAVASSGGFVHPVCALWRAAALPALVPYLASGERSLKGFAEAAGCVAVEWSERFDPFFNINTESDLAEAERRIAR
ncbi:MAG: molybdenum cofactor guanylyltransferase [Parasphingopyxis sp.]|nr:molybdenum cofactor guanylyltransferase [Sphingomonadales bacterium]